MARCSRRFGHPDEAGPAVGPVRHGPAGAAGRLGRPAAHARAGAALARADSPGGPAAPGAGPGARARAGRPAAAARGNDADLRRLIVGREISLSGEITSCDKLVVEGSVEANLQNCHEIEIAESGLFKGSASIDDAEVRGRFEGKLVVRRRLLIRAGGRVTGTIRYGQLEVEAGGVLSGDIQAEGDNVAELTGARAAY